jgi:hypothetical protein
MENTEMKYSAKYRRKCSRNHRAGAATMAGWRNGAAGGWLSGGEMWLHLSRQLAAAISWLAASRNNGNHWPAVAEEAWRIGRDRNAALRRNENESENISMIYYAEKVRLANGLTA